MNLIKLGISVVIGYLGASILFPYLGWSKKRDNETMPDLEKLLGIKVVNRTHDYHPNPTHAPPFDPGMVGVP